MSNILSALNELWHDLYLNILQHYITLFRTHDSYEKLLKEVKLLGTIPYYENGGDVNIEPDLKDVFLLTPENYNVIREEMLNIAGESGLHGNIREDLFRYLQNIANEFRNNFKSLEDVRKKFPNSAIFYPWFGLTYVKANKVTLDELRNNEEFSSSIDSIVLNLFSKTRTVPFSPNVVEDVLEASNRMALDRFANNLIPEQQEIIRKITKNTPLNLVGVAGASKTFTSTLGLITCALSDRVVYKMPITYLLIATTYKACEEMVKNIYKNATNPEIQSVLKKWRVNSINIYFIHASSREKDLERFINNLIQQGMLENEELLVPINLTNSRATQICQNFHPADINFLVSPSAVFKKYNQLGNFGSRLEGIDIQGIHIDESSQFSFSDLIFTLFAAKEYGKRIIKWGEGKKDIRESFWRLSFAGDPRQLSPIYTYADGGINLLKIGPFYNVLSYIHPLPIERIDLVESLRVPPTISKLVSNFYPRIRAYKESVESLRPNSDDELREILSEARELLRVEYFISPGLEAPYPTKLNKIEAKIALDILRAFENSSEKTFLLTPFRSQETFLSREISKMSSKIREHTVAGTVDKTQGQEADLVIFMFTVADQAYAENVSNFIFTPNRFNVAVTRAKKMLVVIASDVISRLSFSWVSGWYKFHLEDMRFAYERLHPSLTSEELPLETAREILVGVDSNQGAHLYQECVQMTSRKIGHLYLPLKVEENQIVPDGELTPDLPSGEHALIKFYTV